ncbi:AraC family transcriptional regulator [Puteibacter caeruleilacunae]|nr:AraC family transcriptional regulator [Puteibacter caeruleilacunae]
MRISEVAFEVGFDDAQYFSKVFKQQMGCTPKDYVKGGTKSLGQNHCPPAGQDLHFCLLRNKAVYF